MAVYNIVGDLNSSNILSIVNDIYKLPKDNEYYFDFEHMKFVEPFAMLYLSLHLRYFVNAVKDFALVYVRNHNHHTYPGHMGFFKAFNVNFGNDMGQAPGSNTYVPITELTRDSALLTGYPGSLNDKIEEYSKDVSEVLLQDISCSNFYALSFCIREIMRNTFEHGRCDSLMFCAQCWRYGGQAHVAIIDTGVGLFKSLNENPHLNITNDVEAIEHSVLPGISSKALRGSSSPLGVSDWENSGFGLYMASEIISKAGGNLLVCSGSNAIRFTDSGKDLYDVVNPLNVGVAISIEWNLNSSFDFRSELKIIRESGYAIERELLSNLDGEQKVSASMLARFRK